MRCAVIVFPGSNCDSDLYKAVNAFEEWMQNMFGTPLKTWMPST